MMNFSFPVWLLGYLGIIILIILALIWMKAKNVKRYIRVITGIVSFTIVLVVVPVGIFIVASMDYNARLELHRQQKMDTAVLSANHTGQNESYDYVLTVKLTNGKDTTIKVTPNIAGVGEILFFTDEGYFIPTEYSTNSYMIPQKAGVYESKMYLRKLDRFEGLTKLELTLGYSSYYKGKLSSTWSQTVGVTNSVY
jgi:hypothetical protein